MTKVTSPWLELATLYDEAKADALCHTGAWEISYQAVLPLDFRLEELERLEAQLQFLEM